MSSNIAAKTIDWNQISILCILIYVGHASFDSTLNKQPRPYNWIHIQGTFIWPLEKQIKVGGKIYQKLRITPHNIIFIKSI